MQYVGSKNRISKELKPIIESYLTDETVAYIEPFVGGANMIDKIDFHTKIGSDIHEELIELLKYARDNSDKLPDTISEEEYMNVKNNKSDYHKWYVGLVGFTATFGSKYFGGFARRYNKDNKLLDVPKTSISSLKKQSDSLQDIKFYCKSYLDYKPSDFKNCVFYLDPPYKGTLKYRDSLDYDELYNWCIDMSKHNIVLISEYDMPEELFDCVWSKEVKVNISNQGDIKQNKRVEKLFKVRGGL